LKAAKLLAAEEVDKKQAVQCAAYQRSKLLEN
jgi:hypothetical protein